MRPSQAILAMEMLRSSSSTPLRRKGVVLSHNDTRTVIDVYQQWLLLMMDLGYLHPDSLSRTGARLFSDMLKADVLDLNNAFAECLHLVRVQSNKGFKGLCSRISTHLYSLIKGDIVQMSQGDVRAAKRLIQAFAYTSRLSLNDLDLTQQMLEAYLDVEDKISDDLPMPLVRRLNKVIRRWMKPFDRDGIYPQHGQGGVAEHGRTSYETKYKSLATDQMLEYAFGSPWWLAHPALPLRRVSKTIFVPKSYKTFRTISMEPTTLMYFQQGVWKEIDRLVRANGYLRSRIDFHDQERNQRLAKQGSIARDFATIDLSSASDSVSYKLVKELFRGTALLRFIVATRSRETVLPDKRQITLKKFAPMGSALCFPIETIIFAAVCEVVTRGFRNTKRYSVFGDDIIVPTQCAEAVMSALGRLGFSVNREKSFYRNHCWFRESCGGEYCDGYDVTPMRVSRKYASRERGVRLEALIESANTAYVKNFRYLRAFFLQEIRRTGFIVLFGPGALLSDNYTNYHTLTHWDPDLQRIDVWVNEPTTRYDRKDLNNQDESIRYRHWLESTAQRTALDEGFQSVVCRPVESYREAWRQKPFEASDQALIDFYVSML